MADKDKMPECPKHHVPLPCQICTGDDGDEIAGHIPEEFDRKGTKKHTDN